MSCLPRQNFIRLAPFFKPLLAREYAFGPAQGLPDSRIGTFTRPLFDEAMQQGWTVISMRRDRKRLFAFEA